MNVSKLPFILAVLYKYNFSDNNFNIKTGPLPGIYPQSLKSKCQSFLVKRVTSCHIKANAFFGERIENI